jgi:phosphate/sulfate permease
MQIEWLELLEQVLDLVLVPLIGGAIAYFVAILKSKTKNELVEKYIDMLDNTIMECVLATNQTYVDVLKKAGTFDEEAQKQAFQLTFDAVAAVLTDEARKYLNEAIKDLDAYMTTKIEAQVGLQHH